MQNFIRAAATAASLSLAILPVVTFAGAAFAQERVQVADLQLANTSDAQTFAKRVDGAAMRFCSQRTAVTELSQTQACREAIHAEVIDKLSPSQRAALRAS